MSRWTLTLGSTSSARSAFGQFVWKGKSLHSLKDFHRGYKEWDTNGYIGLYRGVLFLIFSPGFRSFLC